MQTWLTGHQPTDNFKIWIIWENIFVGLSFLLAQKMRNVEGTDILFERDRSNETKE